MHILQGILRIVKQLFIDIVNVLRRRIGDIADIIRETLFYAKVKQSPANFIDRSRVLILDPELIGAKRGVILIRQGIPDCTLVEKDYVPRVTLNDSKLVQLYMHNHETRKYTMIQGVPQHVISFSHLMIDGDYDIVAYCKERNFGVHKPVLLYPLAHETCIARRDYFSVLKIQCYLRDIDVTPKPKTRCKKGVFKTCQ